MGELLKNILTLRDEINKLTDLGNEKSYEYCELAIKIADVEDDISNMLSKQEKLKNNIVDFKFKKGILFFLPIGITTTGAFFTYCLINNWNSLVLDTALIAILGTPTFGFGIAYLLSSLFVHTKIFTNYLSKNYDHLKEMNKQLNNLMVRIKITENNLIDIKKQKEEITNFIVNSEDIIECKREELHKLEQEYFNNIKNNPIAKGTTYDVSPAGKKRTRTIGNTRN